MQTLVRKSLFIVILFSGLCGAETSYFAVLNDGVKLTDFSKQIESLGAKIILRVPPQILTFSAATAPDSTILASIKNIYTGPVSIQDLKSYGPVATGAGLQWNRTLANNAPQMSAKGGISIKSLVAKSSLPAPMNLKLSAVGMTLQAGWDAVPGALLTQIQISKTPDFRTIDLQSYTDTSSIALPALAGEVYVRVRALESSSAGLTGEWSAPQRTAFALPNMVTDQDGPVLTSPLDQSESDGFLVVLEWLAEEGIPYRIQVTKGTDTHVDQIVTGGEFVVPSALLQKGDKFSWRVQKWAPHGSRWSAAREFTVGEPQNNDRDALVNPEAPK